MALLSNRRRKEIGKLGRSKFRKTKGQSLVEGVRAVESAIEAGAPLVDILVTRNAAHHPTLSELLKRVDVPVYEVEPDDLAQLSDVQTHQGVLAVVERLIAPTEKWARCRSILFLDGVQDPGNVGTLLRTAAWFGVEAVVGGAGTAGLYHPKVLRAAMGAHWDLKLAQHADIRDLPEIVDQEETQLVGADLDGVPVSTWQPAERTMLIMGSEAHGLSPAARTLLDLRISIRGGASSRKGTESLNVAVSGGIVMYAWLGR